MDHFAGLDVSVKQTSICIVDDTGRIVREVKVVSEPEALLTVLKNPAYHFERIGLEAGPLSVFGLTCSKYQSIIEPIIQRRVGRRQTPAVSAALCEFVHNHLRSSGTEYGSRRAQAMTQQPVKRIPQWLRIDLLVIVVSLAIIGFYIFYIA
jgi:hypothetical protein